ISVDLYVDENGKAEKAEDIKAMSYNIDDGYLQKDFLSPLDIFPEVLSKNVRRKTFAIPKARVGSIIEYQYTIITPFLFMLPDWEFQSDIPTIWSMYRVKMIPWYSYVYIGQGMEEYDHLEKYQEKYRTVSDGLGYGTHDLVSNIYELGMRNVPAFESEEFITSKDDFLMKVDFQLAHVSHPSGGITDVITTYPKMIQDLVKYDDYGKYISKSERAAKDVIESLSLDNLEEIEKIEAIVNAVKATTIYNGVPRLFSTKSPKDLLVDKRGNSAEINLFLVGALRSAGFTADPVLLSTRDHGKINGEYPFLSYFNYSVVLVTWGGNRIIVDATSDYLPFNRIPPECFNGSGLVVNNKENEVLWVDLNSVSQSTESISLNHSLNEDTGLLEGFCVMQSTGYEGFKRRRNFADKNEKIEEFYSKHFSQVDNIKTNNFDNPSLAYTVAAQGSSEVERIADNFFLQPLSNFPMQENLLKATIRNYPVDMIYPYSHVFDSRITIPKGYVINDFPKPLSVDDELMTVRYKCYFENDVLLTLAEVDFKKAVYLPSEYSIIREYINNMVTHFNAPVLVEKVK
ncbi:MAG: hypothetical protein RIF46_05715, partial [Cyclobacteriaceae bacterium]